MRPGSRHIGAGLTLLAFAIAFLQRPGESTSDTKIDLHVEPIRFLGEVASVWSSSGGLGQVQGGQYSGYLFPMGPFFAIGEFLGVAPWVVHRLWLGTLLAVGAWGVVKLLDALAGEARPVAQSVAGALYVVNPYVTTFAQATSVTLLGYAALPWLVLAVHRGVRSPRRWWWPGVFALAFTATGGGVNAAVTGWLLLGPALLLVYEWLDRRDRVAGGVGGRLAHGGAHARGVPVVARSGRRACGAGNQLPPVHRVRGSDLDDHQPAGEPAPDGVLAELPRRRLRRAAAAVLRRKRRASVLGAGCGRVAARAGAGGGGARSGAGAGRTRRSSCCSSWPGCSS